MKYYGALPCDRLTDMYEAWGYDRHIIVVYRLMKLTIVIGLCIVMG